MKEIFSKLSNFFNLSKENRLAHGAETPPEANVDAAQTDEPKPPLGLKGTKELGADLFSKDKLGKMFEGMGTDLAGEGLSDDLKDSIGQLKTTEATEQPLTTRGEINTSAQQAESMDIGDIKIDTTRAKMSDYERALDDATKVELSSEQASAAYTDLIYQLAQRGPDTNLREDNFKTVQDAIGKALKDMPDFKLKLAQVHTLKEKGMDRDLSQLAGEVQVALSVQQSGNEQLLAYLGSQPDTSQAEIRVAEID
ncbi:hypothetical protein KAR91_64630 [Candidatus Pacearchaeota archaeon]|nr:hypothetical protein [Candidatus Pacearchaeota archaeon]